MEKICCKNQSSEFVFVPSTLLKYVRYCSHIELGHFVFVLLVFFPAQLLGVHNFNMDVKKSNVKKYTAYPECLL